MHIFGSNRQYGWWSYCELPLGAGIGADGLPERYWRRRYGQKYHGAETAYTRGLQVQVSNIEHGK